MKKTIITIFILCMCLCVCTACGEKEKNKEKTEANKVVEKEEDVDTEIISSNAVINTEYIPIDYRQNALIVQRNEDTELFGVINNDGVLVIEPEYDGLRFINMGGVNYIRASLEDKLYILNLDGSCYIDFGLEYDDIDSAGNIGWLAKKDGVQYLLDSQGEVIRQLAGEYEEVICDRYLITAFNSESMSREIYDLEENLLLEHVWSVYHIENEYSFVTLRDLYGDRYGFKLLYMNIEKGEILEDFGENQDLFDIVKMDDDRVIIRKMIDYTAVTHKSKYEHYIYDLSTNTLSSESLKDKWADADDMFFDFDCKIVEVKNNGLYRIYDIDENEIIEGRYKECREFDESNCMILKDVDDELGLVDIKGNIIIPFGVLGDTTDDWTYNGKQIEDDIIESDGCFGFYIKNGSGYTFYNYTTN